MNGDISFLFFFFNMDAAGKWLKIKKVKIDFDLKLL